VKWTRGTRNDDVIDVRGRRGSAAKLGGGGIVAVLVVYVVARMFGVDVSGLVGGGGGPAEAPSQAEPPAGADPEAEQVDFIRFVMKDIQDTLEGLYRQAGRPYRRAQLYVFREAIDTRCGRSSSAIGPFYCPGDENAYIDLSFFRDLARRFQAPGLFAQAYVLAHEMGHHLQTLEGARKKTRRLGRDRASQNAASVRQELQADCYAGVWGHSANARKIIEVGDLEAAQAAAGAVGDDRHHAQG
jgi:predicted metalloprotease